MKLNTIIIGFLALGFFVVSTVLTVSSILSFKNNNTETFRLFKEELLELSRESFTNSSSLFFSYLDNRAKAATSSQAILDIVKDVDSTDKSVAIYDISRRIYLLEPQDKEAAVLLDDDKLGRYIQENTLNLKNTFDLDNFQAFLDDATGKMSPTKIQLRFYDNLGLIVVYQKAFTTVKVRMEFIHRKNDQLFYSYLIFSIITVLAMLAASIIAMVFMMRTAIIKPLKKIVYGLEQVEKGSLDARIDIQSNNEVGEIAKVFNKMTGDLERSRTKLEDYSKTLEQKVSARTEELNSKLVELERMNEVMLGRELKMIELKKEIEDLKAAKKA